MLRRRSLQWRRVHGFFFSPNATLLGLSTFPYRYSARIPSTLTASSSDTFHHTHSLRSTRPFSSASARWKEKSTRSRDGTEEKNEDGSEDKQVESGKEKD